MLRRIDGPQHGVPILIERPLEHQVVAGVIHPEHAAGAGGVESLRRNGERTGGWG